MKYSIALPLDACFDVLLADLSAPSGVSRLVILPDYQGIGLGVKFLNEIAKIYSKKGFDFSIKTSAKNLIFALKNRKEWILNDYGIGKDTEKIMQCLRNKLRTKCKTASFFYKKRGDK